MFNYKSLQTLNSLELNVYKYVIAHKAKVTTMTIRELSQETYVSTTTILRFCNKMGYEGFSELKYHLKQEAIEPDLQKQNPRYSIPMQVKDFLTKVSDPVFNQRIEAASELIKSKKTLIFIGIGTSGNLSQYGSRLFNNYHHNSYYVNDGYQPVPDFDFTDTLIMALSVSGETPEILKQTILYKQKKATILAITNSEQSTLAEIADMTLPYYMQEIKSDGEHVDITTQVPVVYILEVLASMSS